MISFSIKNNKFEIHFNVFINFKVMNLYWIIFNLYNIIRIDYVDIVDFYFSKIFQDLIMAMYSSLKVKYD
jgi:hypothetical protein